MRGESGNRISSANAVPNGVWDRGVLRYDSAKQCRSFGEGARGKPFCRKGVSSQNIIPYKSLSSLPQFGVDEPDFDAELDHFQPVFDAQLFHDVGPVFFHRFGA